MKKTHYLKSMIMLLIPSLLLTSCKISKEISKEELLSHIDEISTSYQEGTDFYFTVKYNDKISNGDTKESSAYSQVNTYKKGLGFFNLEREKINDLRNSGERIRIGLLESNTVYEFTDSMDAESTKYYYDYDKEELPQFTYLDIAELTAFGLELFTKAIPIIESGTNLLYVKTGAVAEKEMSLRSSVGKISYTTRTEKDQHYYSMTSISYTLNNIKYVKAFSISYTTVDDGKIKAPGDIDAYIPKPTA